MNLYIPLFVIVLLIQTTSASYGQDDAEQRAVTAEGKLLYRSEMASWYGTDIFLEKFPEKRQIIGGYFSYADGDVEKCLFFSNTSIPKVLATISFDSTYNTRTAKVDNTFRNFTSFENDLYTIRKTTLELISTDSLFKTYRNTNFNLIPLIANDLKKVFVLTGPKQSGVVIFGNDYLVTFDDNNQVIGKRQLHKNIIPTEYSTDTNHGSKKVVGAMHTHLPETGDLMTSTDICTLMLYQKFAGWESYIVVSEKYTNIWLCKTNLLVVVTRDAIDKINRSQEKKDKN
jgi:hypothetical protein